MDYTEKTLSREEKYSGIIVDIHVDDIELINGARSKREVVEHPGGVTVIPLDDDGFVYCVRQYRYAVGEHLLEVPAGKLEPGEDPMECAVRELSEETGLTAENMTDLGKIYPSPGFCRETLYIYLARGLKAGRAHPDENEFLDMERIHIDQLCRMVMDGEITDAKTVVAVMKTKKILEGRENG